MKPKTYQVLTLAVDEGVAYGIRNAYKHNENPSQEYIAACVADAVLNSICEWFHLEEDVHGDA